MSKLFSRFAAAVAVATGKPVTFALSMIVIVIWAFSGPVFHYSDTWQLIINTGTTIITFLMVFVIQNAQNRDGAAIQAKLDELIRAGAAQNRFIGIEHLTDEELTKLRETCAERGRVTRQEVLNKASDEAEAAANARARRATEAF